MQWPKEKRTKGQIVIYKTLDRKLNIEQHEPAINQGELRCSGRVGSPCSTSHTRPVTLITNPVESRHK